MIDEIVKQSIFNLLFDDMDGAEVIDLGKSIWVINKETRYWYFEYQTDTKNLWWRYDFFLSYLTPFGMNEVWYHSIFSEFFNYFLNQKQFNSAEVKKLCEGDFVSILEMDQVLSDDRELQIKMKQILDEKRSDV